jgi:hypothetical protein
LTTLVLWIVYGAAGVAAAGAARFVRRPIGRPAFALFFVLPVMFLYRGFVSDRTPVPVEDVRLFAPWSYLPPPFGIPEPRRNPSLNDIALQIAPWTKAVRVAWKSGDWPWLDRWNGCGTPLAANAQSAAFSPFTFLGFALPLARAFTLTAALKLFLALTGMALWLSELRLSRSASIFGAVAFAFSLEMTVWLPWQITAVVCLWPWGLFLLERLDDPDSRRRAFVLLAAVLAAWALAGHPESAALGAAFMGIWLVFRLATRAWKYPRAVVGSAIMAGIFALGSTSFLLLPQIAAIRASNRRINAEHFVSPVATSWVRHAPLWPAGFLTPFFPRAYGDAIEAPILPYTGYSFPELSCAYPSAAAWLLVLLALRPGHRRRREIYGLAAIAAFAFAAASWSWPVVELLAHLPGIGVMLPLRYFAWIPISVAALAAFELDRFRADVTADRRRAFWLAGAAALFGGAGLLVFRHFRAAYAATGGYDAEKAGLKSLAIMLVTIAAAAAAAAVLPALGSRGRERLLFAALLAGCGIELFLIAQPLDRFGRSELVFPETPLVRFLQSRSRPFRVVGTGNTLFPNANVFAGVEDVRTHDPMERKDYVAFLDATCGYPPGEYFKFLGNPDAAALDFLNVAYAIAPPGSRPPGERWSAAYSGPDGAVFENSRVLPRIFAPPSVRLLAPSRQPGFEDAFAAFGSPPAVLLSGIDWHRQAIVLPDPGAPFPRHADLPAPEISEVQEETNRVTFSGRVAGNEPRIVVASEVQDGGWRARDEVGRLATGRANGPFLAVVLRPGRHRITLAYSPPGLRAGLVITACTAILAAIAAGIGFHRAIR